MYMHMYINKILGCRTRGLQGSRPLEETNNTRGGECHNLRVHAGRGRMPEEAAAVRREAVRQDYCKGEVG